MFTRAHVSMITYGVDVYRSRQIGASLLAGRGRPAADADRYRCACLTQVLAGRGHGYQCGVDWGVLIKVKGKGSLICIALYYEPLVSKVRLGTRLSTRAIESSIYRDVPIALFYCSSTLSNI